MFDEEFGRKTLLSTGAASGMGLLICEEFLKYGGNAIMADIDGDALRGQADRLNGRYPGRALAIACDVREYAQVCRVRDEGVKAFGSIDVLANFAGGAETRVCGVGGDFCDVPIEAYDWGIDVNLRAQLYFPDAPPGQRCDRQYRLGHRRRGRPLCGGLCRFEERCDARIDEIGRFGRCKVRHPLCRRGARPRHDPSGHGRNEDAYRKRRRSDRDREHRAVSRFVSR